MVEKGHDIYIVAEPYKEAYNGNVFDKKRFYFLFTDSRVPNNIYDRILQCVDMKNIRMLIYIICLLVIQQ